MIDQTIRTDVSAVIGPREPRLVLGSDWFTDHMLISANLWNAANKNGCGCRIKSITPKDDATGAPLVMRRVEFAR